MKIKKIVLAGVLSISLLLMFMNGCEDDKNNSSDTDSGVSINISDATLDWGTVPNGHISDKTISFTNSTGSSGSLKGKVTISGDGYYIVTGGGSYSLGNGQTRTVKVRFSTPRRGRVTGQLKVDHNAGNKSSPVVINLTATVQ